MTTSPCPLVRRSPALKAGKDSLQYPSILVTLDRVWGFSCRPAFPLGLGFSVQAALVPQDDGRRR